MNDMIKAEREKILSRKQTKNSFYYRSYPNNSLFFFCFNLIIVLYFYNYDTGKMDTVSGFAAIEQKKKMQIYLQAN